MNLPHVLIQILAFLSLFALLFSIGLGLSLHELRLALKNVRPLPILLINFILVPLIGVAILQFFGAEMTTSRALLLLAAAPFAPVVPLFVRMSRGPVAFAAALTGIMPLFSCVLTPVSLALGLWLLGDTQPIEASPLRLFGSLFCSITAPLICGLTLHSLNPRLSLFIQKPMEWLAETIGVLSLMTLFWMESSSLSGLSKDPILAAALLSELAFVSGYFFYPGASVARMTHAFGSSNRNIGLSLFIAVTVLDDQTLLAPLFAESLTLIGLGLIHTAFFRWFSGGFRQRRQTDVMRQKDIL